MKAADEFVSHDEIINRIKDIVSRNKEGIVFDADIEIIVGVPKNGLSKIKSRGSKNFYIQVLKLCARTGLDPMKLLF